MHAVLMHALDHAAHARDGSHHAPHPTAISGGDISSGLAQAMRC